MHRDPEIRKTLTTFVSSGTKRLLAFFLTFRFFDTRRETHNYYYADSFSMVLQSTPKLNWPAQSQLTDPKKA